MNGQNQIDQPQAPVVSIKEWLLTNLILMIPLVNIVMTLVWAFGSNTNPNKANYFKAALILFVIYLVLAVAVVIFGSAAANQYQ
ncbi:MULTISPECIES: hypothetical protein [Neisseria]|jgi:hypothetical protein|uniref:Uncharacterized protein n=2 Tax=Neisseria TaxID=482 RepID=A0ABD7EYI8_NEIPE|nr:MULTISPECIES: hypothetical protein [Neisseria]KZC78795.1 hypothetical protein TW89_1006 [Neisseria flavescens]MCL9788136.1 hypothetical protein [Neisseria subflava]OHQ05817.1 hypothetical protein HMPREF2608_09130 [Neisseria sp. HMSC064D07]QXW90822.1 hypothetical protein LPB400_01955 [Neisseria perflava]QXW93900.1 hypothetical protein LPB402_06155 [Neisseria sicca ATCC 29256]